MSECRVSVPTFCMFSLHPEVPAFWECHSDIRSALMHDWRLPEERDFRAPALSTISHAAKPLESCRLLLQLKQNLLPRFAMTVSDDLSCTTGFMFWLFNMDSGSNMRCRALFPRRRRRRNSSSSSSHSCFYSRLTCQKNRLESRGLESWIYGMAGLSKEHVEAKIGHRIQSLLQLRGIKPLMFVT